MQHNIQKGYTRQTVNPFERGQFMDYCTAKGFIDDAWRKRYAARVAIKSYRECGLEGDMLKTSYFYGVVKQSLKNYRQAQSLSIRAYHKCLSDISSKGAI